MKKKLTVLAVAASLSMMSVSAFAATSPSSAQQASAVVQNVHKALNPQMQAVQNLQDSLKGLRQQEKQINAQLKELWSKNKAAVKAVRGQIDPAKQAEMKSLAPQIKAVKEQIQPIAADIKAEKAALKTAKANKDTAGVQAAKDKLTADMAQLKSIQASHQADFDKLKELRGTVASQKAGVKSTLQPLQDLYAQSKNARSQLKTLNQSMKAQLQSLRTAKKNKDVNGATQALNELITLEQQTIAQKQVLLNLAQKANTALQATTPTA